MDDVAESQVEETTEELGDQEEEVTHETEISHVCPDCEGSGLADKKTMGRQAEKVCTPCQGSGRV